jgi:hypothetical protein
MKLIPAGKALLVGAVAVGALSLGTAGVAGAASPASAPALGKKFNCANATKALTRIEKTESRIGAGLPKLNAAEGKATAKGHTRRAERLKKRIARLENPALKARLVKRAAAI